MTLLRVVRAVGGGLKDAVRARLLRLAHASVEAAFPGGELRQIEIERSGRVRLTGTGALPAFQVTLNGEPAALAQTFELLDGSFCAEYAAKASGLARGVAVSLDGRQLARLALALPLQEPPYAALFDEKRVLHRDGIYGWGPAATEAHPDVVALAKLMPAPLLDFGCGSGALVRALRTEGRDARGIELDRPEITASLRDDVRPYVTINQGAMPLPFRDGEFASVTCVEVLEHIPDYETAVSEMARLAREALVTVPDMSAIPALFPHFVVPWHLLERTHVNFFTQASLDALLGKHFSRVRFSRMGPFEVNGTRVFTSIVARCSR